MEFAPQFMLTSKDVPESVSFTSLAISDGATKIVKGQKPIISPSSAIDKSITIDDSSTSSVRQPGTNFRQIYWRGRLFKV